MVWWYIVHWSVVWSDVLLFGSLSVTFCLSSACLLWWSVVICPVVCRSVSFCLLSAGLLYGGSLLSIRLSGGLVSGCLLSGAPLSAGLVSAGLLLRYITGEFCWAEKPSKVPCWDSSSAAGWGSQGSCAVEAVGARTEELFMAPRQAAPCSPPGL